MTLEDIAATAAARAKASQNGDVPHDDGIEVSNVDLLIELSAHRAARGGVVLDAPETVESRWGDGHRCLWARNEPFVMCGPDGVGKTTVAQQLVLHLIGVLSGLFLGLPVQLAQRVLYLACDRPTQALRSFRRMVTDEHRELLDERLAVWRGPLPFDLAREPKALVTLAQRFGADVIVVDSMKDIAADLSKEETGLGLNAAFQHAVAEGIDVLGLHHQRKQQPGAGKPRHLSDVYGSRWLTAGAGSVVMLWGEAGDSVVDLDHLKQPDETIGPLKVLHDHANGISTVAETRDAWSIVHDARNGVTAITVAATLFGSPTPGRNEIEKARRQLDRLAKEGKVYKRDGTKGGSRGGDATTYYPLAIVQGGQE
ncbi:MAG: AAA family ATPase [Acidimicrobiales bacterium]